MTKGKITCGKCGRILEESEVKNHFCGRFEYLKRFFMQDSYSAATVASVIIAVNVPLPWNILAVVLALYMMNDGAKWFVRRYIYDDV